MIEIKMIKALFFLILTLDVNYTEAQMPGCTDPLASNYNAAATVNDGSCIYSLATVTPVSSVPLPEIIYETSGLIFWNDKLWAHNDSEDIKLYAFSPYNVNNFQSYPLTGVLNNDWEEISQDNKYIYIGDFGNNSGNRTNLKILRIDKSSLIASSPLIDTISFSYSAQTDFNPPGANKTDFDCEAFILTTDSIYLFTKEWISKKTSIYSLPKNPGNYVARYNYSIDVQGLITGAIYMESKKLIALSGYSEILQPFVYLLYDFKEHDFHRGNKRKINTDLLFHQVEGITTTDGLIYFLSNERFVYSTLSIPPQLHVLDLSVFLNNYFNRIANSESVKRTNPHIYPVPTEDFIYVETKDYHSGSQYYVLDIRGTIVKSGLLDTEVNMIDISPLPAGEYIFLSGNENHEVRKILKQ